MFDFDKVEADDQADAIQRYLPAECQNVGYVVQHSASMFDPRNDKFPGHIHSLSVPLHSADFVLPAASELTWPTLFEGQHIRQRPAR